MNWFGLRSLPGIFALGLATALIGGCGRTDLDFGIGTENTTIPGNDAGGGATGTGGAGGRNIVDAGRADRGADATGDTRDARDTGGATDTRDAGSADRGGSGGRGGSAGMTGAGGRGGAGGSNVGGSGGGGAGGAAGAGGSGAAGGAPTGAGGGGGGGATTGAGGGGGTGATTGAGGGGGGGRGGAGGAGGNPGGGSIPCGQMSCRAGAEACCIRPTAAPAQVCISVREQCNGGARVGCTDGGACGRGQVCCLTLPGFDSRCAPAVACLLGTNVMLCSADSQCPGVRPHCCRALGLGVCQANPCPGR